MAYKNDTSGSYKAGEVVKGDVYGISRQEYQAKYLNKMNDYNLMNKVSASHVNTRVDDFVTISDFKDADKSPY